MKAMPIIADHFDRGVFPMELIPQMARWAFSVFTWMAMVQREKPHHLWFDLPGLVSVTAGYGHVFGPDHWPCIPSMPLARKSSEKSGCRDGTGRGHRVLRAI